MPTRFLAAALCVTLWLLTAPGRAQDPLAAGFDAPPESARLRAYWWWLNGNVDDAAITSDLEWMKKVGMGGALVCDAGGPAGPTPLGPTYGSPAWIAHLKHAAIEADRLGLQLSITPQSGWNVGGPSVTPATASKKITWSQLQIPGGIAFSAKLPPPPAVEGAYGDVVVLAYRTARDIAGRTPRPKVVASSTQAGFSADGVVDPATKSYWVSGSNTPGAGPSESSPQWIELVFPAPVKVSGITVTGRPGYGPKACAWEQSVDGKTFETIKQLNVEKETSATVRFDPVESRYFRLRITSAFDPKFPDRPRNVQVARVTLLDPAGEPIDFARRPEPISELSAKSDAIEFAWSPTDSAPLLEESPGDPSAVDTAAGDVVDITNRMAADGTLNWTAPAGGDWTVLRFGWTVNGAHVSTSSGTYTGLVVDYLDGDALRQYWAAVVEPILTELGPLAGKSVVGIETDSWEAGGLNWTAKMPAEFRARRGYDITPWLPVLAGRIVDSRDKSNRFLTDLRRTIADLMADQHYAVLAQLASRHGMIVHCESSGPHTGPFDGQMNLGRSDEPMSEFWAPSPHRSTDSDRFFVKCASSAAHMYGKRIACAEGFTEIGHDWNDPLWSNLKTSFDHEACAGLNLVYWHAFTCAPASTGVPGQQYFAGTHLDPRLTWADDAPAFVGYLDRCQFMLQQGMPVIDVCVYTGDQCPNIVARKQTDPAGVLPNYDYDAFGTEVLLTRMTVKDHRIVLPDGMSYRVMVLPNMPSMPVVVIDKIRQLVDAGATVVGARPDHTASLSDYPNADAKVRQTAAALWDAGRIISGKPTRAVLSDCGVVADFDSPDAGRLDFVHRRTDDADIYFVRNEKPAEVTTPCTFRVAGRQPELWDAVRGTRTDARAFSQTDGRTTLPIRLPAYGSIFVVFRRSIPATQSGVVDTNWPTLSDGTELTGPWNVSFDPKMGGPATVVFDALVDWTARPEEGIRHYSGTATYRKTFDAPVTGTGRVVLDLGVVHELARVRLNGQDLGVIWCPPWSVELPVTLKPTGNQLEIDIVNFWPNRLIGDAALPVAQRYTRTNVSFKATDPLIPSGLIGPVRVREVR